MIYDYRYLLFVMLPSLLLALWAQGRVQHAFKKYSRIRSSSGMTGAEAAAVMLRNAGLSSAVNSYKGDPLHGYEVHIERIGGFLSDHYDPRAKVLRLSPEVYDSDSLAAVGIACHEAGHAVQDATQYAPLTLRNAIVPTANIGSQLGFWLVVIGLFMHALTLAWLGVILFASVVVFQIVNLPVEFNASRRAKQMLPALGIISGREESKAINQVLDAAAMTYVAATVGALLQLLYFISLLNRRN
ncbi:zinc metallopeptidase [bacterium]|nr:zinc metallopeptidase [bacterium]